MLMVCLKEKPQRSAHRCSTNQGNKHLLPHNDVSAVYKHTLKAIGAAQCSSSATGCLTDTPKPPKVVCGTQHILKTTTCATHL